MLPEKAPKPFYKNWLFWIITAAVMISVCPVVAFATFMAREFIVQMPKAKQAMAELEIEFQTITPLPNVKTVRYNASYKTSQAFVEATYSTNVNSDDIFSYYDEQLIQHGWQYYKTSRLTDWGTDLGGKSAEYCKGDYVASIQYAGNKANYGWTYAFNLSWGLSDCEKK